MSSLFRVKSVTEVCNVPWKWLDTKSHVGTKLQTVHVYHIMKRRAPNQSQQGGVFVLVCSDDSLPTDGGSCKAGFSPRCKDWTQNFERIKSFTWTEEATSEPRSCLCCKCLKPSYFCVHVLHIILSFTCAHIIPIMADDSYKETLNLQQSDTYSKLTE